MPAQVAHPGREGPGRECLTASHLTRTILCLLKYILRGGRRRGRTPKEADDARGLLAAPLARGEGGPRATPAVALRGRLPRDRVLGRARRGAGGAPARTRPAPRPRPLRGPVRGLAVLHRRRRRAARPGAQPVPGVLHRRQRAPRRRGGDDLPVHLGRPRLRARPRLDPGLPEEARLDLDHPHVRASSAGPTPGSGPAPPSAARSRRASGGSPRAPSRSSGSRRPGRPTTGRRS